MNLFHKFPDLTIQSIFEISWAYAPCFHQDSNSSRILPVNTLDVFHDIGILKKNFLHLQPFLCITLYLKKHLLRWFVNSSICIQDGWGFSSNHFSSTGNSVSGSNIRRERAAVEAAFDSIETDGRGDEPVMLRPSIAAPADNSGDEGFESCFQLHWFFPCIFR